MIGGLYYGCGVEESEVVSYEVQTITEDGYKYEIVTNDDLQLRV